MSDEIDTQDNKVEQTDIQTNEPTEEENKFNILDNDTDLNETSDEITDNSNNEMIEEPIPEETNELNNLEITWPNIETVNEEIKDDDDEDVWKF